MRILLPPGKVARFTGMALLFFACRKEDAPPPVRTGPVTKQEINTWILDSMRYYYLWNTGLPPKPDTQLNAIKFFNSLKKATDTFSRMIDFSDQAGTVQKDMLHAYGIDYTVISINDIQQPIGLIKFVIPGSAAYQNGLRRGDYFTKINRKQLTTSNAVQLEKELMNANNGTITKAAIDGTSVTDSEEVSIENRLLLENPLYASKVLNIGNKKTGYIFYNYFDDYYDDALLTAFTTFKNNNVTELILDLRYNPGGSLTAATALSALIAPGITENSTFIRYTGNNKTGNQSISFKNLLSVPLSKKYISFSTLSAGRPTLSRAFILTTALSASASEAVVNNLKPYIQVITIGERTYGKDKGSVVITDMRTPQRITWALYPITYLLSNAKGEGGYDKGIAPDHFVDELGTQPLLPIGDTADPLIARAISIITGNGRTGNNERNVTIKPWYDSRKKASMDSKVIIPR
ncbi:MAG TPA: S41 family peptidase [Chitinophaga sp.]|nr:S41 family peptidase [Chitinophaga sp.]